MTIAAKRFKVLDEETNVAVADFYSSTSSDIFNSPNNIVNEITTDLAAFVDNAKGTSLDSITSAITNSTSIALPASVADAASAIGSATQAATRTAKGISGALKDISGLSTKSLDKLVSEALPDNPLVQSTFNKLSGSCKNKALSSGGLGKPFDVSLNCNGSKRSGSSSTCNSSSYGDLLNKLTGGSYNSTWADGNAALKALVSLANYGYNLNLCGVFGALSSGISSDPGVLSRASGSLLGTLSSAGNTLGVLDVIKSSAGLHPLLENPSAISQVFSGVSIPNEIKEYGLPDLSSTIGEAVDSLDAGWDTSDFDDITSSAMLDASNNEMMDLLRSSVMENAVNEDALDEVKDTAYDYMYGATMA